MKLIPLTQGQFAKVDDADYEWLSQWKWTAQWATKTKSFYAQRKMRLPDGRRTVISMHRQIMGLEYGDKRTVDHRNHNTLDNQRNELRIATNKQNTCNKRKHHNSRSQYKGVSWNRARKYWTAQIMVDGKHKWLGAYEDQSLAHAAYCEAALKLHGEFAGLE